MFHRVGHETGHEVGDVEVVAIYRSHQEVIANIGVKDKMIAIYLSAVIHKAAVDGLEEAADELLKSEGGLPS